MQTAYAKVVNRLLEAMEAGSVPWKRPWITPINAVSGKAYRGINFLMLLTAEYADPRYITYLQAIDLGGHVRQGEQGFPVVKWHFPNEDDVQKNPNAKPWVKGYTVFNVEQCENLVKLPALSSVERNPIVNAQAIVDGWSGKPKIEFGGYQAAYNPTLDRIIMPEMEKFRTPEAYYDTLFHELAHSTGHATRLNRDQSPRYMADKYGLEELVAEIGGAMLCAEAGIDNANLIQNNAAYLQSWMNAVKNDPNMIVRAAGMAAKATDLILDRDNKEETDEVQSDEQLMVAA